MEDIDAAIQVMLYEGKSKNSTNQVNNSNRFQQTVLLIFFFSFVFPGFNSLAKVLNLHKKLLANRKDK